MTINYPTSLDDTTIHKDTWANTDTVKDVHPVAHNNASDAIIALETKVGANSSAVNTTHDYKLSGVTTGDKAVSKTGTEILTNKTLTTPTIGDFTNSGHTHQNAAGGGTLTEAALALTDVTTANVSTSAHGFVPKAPNDVTKFLNGLGAFTVPSGGTAVNVFVSTSGTLSITTTVSQVVVAFGRANQINSSAITMSYNGTQKDSCTVNTSNVPGICMYTETPGAATHNITLASTGGSISSSVIIAIIIG